MRRLLLILWRIANYPVGAFGLFQMLDAAGENVAYDEFGNEYGVDIGIGVWLKFGLGLAVLWLVAVSASYNKEIRDRRSHP
jgi:hypothetical protein